MLRQKFVVIVSLGIFSVAAVGMGQDASQSPATNQKPQKSISIFGQLDQFGKKLVSGIFPDKSADSEKNSSPSMSSRFRRGPMQGEFDEGRAGSVLDAKEKSPSVGKTVAVTKGLSKEIAGQKNSPATAGMAVEKRAAVVRRSQPQTQPQSREVADAPLPLHQRLMGLSRSSFGNNKPSKSAGEDKDVAAIINQNLAKPKPTIAQAPARSAKTSQTVKTEAGAKPTLARRPTSARSAIAARPTIAKGPVAGGTTTKKAPAKKAASVPTLARRPDTRQPAAKKSVAKSKASGSVLVESRVSGERGENVLFDRRSPMLHVRTMGPRQITVGKESTYTVFIDNLGKAEAADVAVVIELPQSAEILGADPSQGVTRRPRAVGDRARFDWQVGNLAAGGSEEIALRIVPRESSPIDLGVSWNFKPTVLQAKIEVQEPKLEIKLNGPREAAFGKCQKYKLEIANNGTGVAEDVGITIMPVTPGKGMPSTHRLGVFPAGKKMSLEIALTPRQKDDLAVRVDLQNEGKVCARLDEKILVRKAELEMVAEGPDMQYVGTVATYRIRLRNTGNADAKGLNVAANIPAQAKYLASDNGGKLLEGGKAVWQLESLAAGDEKIIEIKCELVRSGFNRIDVETTAAEEIQVSTAVGTNVEAMADLALNVVDPTGAGSRRQRGRLPDADSQPWQQTGRERRGRGLFFARHRADFRQRCSPHARPRPSALPQYRHA